MGNVLVQIEEKTFVEINEIIKKAESNAELVTYYADAFIILETAVRMGNVIHIGDTEELCVDEIPLSQLLINMRRDIHESRITDAGQS